MIFLDFLLNLLLFKFEKRAICVKKLYSSLIFRLFFAYLSLILRHILGCASSPTFLRLSIPYLSLTYPLHIPYISLTYPLHIPYLSLTYPLHIPYLSLTYPLPIAYLSLKVRWETIMNFEF